MPSLPSSASHSLSTHKPWRTTAYLATRSAVRYNPMLRAFYQRLREAGKPVKVLQCAAARKLLHLAWALVTKHQPFDPLRHLPPPLAAA